MGWTLLTKTIRRLLPDDCQYLIETNQARYQVNSVTSKLQAPFRMGGDGGEERYFIDLTDKQGRVYKFDIETNDVEILSNTWAEYLEHVQQIIDEFEREQRETAAIDATPGVAQ